MSVMYFLYVKTKYGQSGRGCIQFTNTSRRREFVSKILVLLIRDKYLERKVHVNVHKYVYFSLALNYQ